MNQVERLVFRLAPYGISALSVLLLLTPLLYNGTPLYYPDSMGYIFWGSQWEPVPERVSTYAVVIKILALGRDLWIPVLFQGLLAIWVLKRLWNRISGKIPAYNYYLVLFLLGILSPLGWTASTLMPDLYCALSSLFLFFLLFPGPGKKAGLSDLAGFIFCSSQHLSALMINALLLICCILYWLLSGSLSGRALSIRFSFAGLFLAYACTGIIHMALSGKFYLSRSGPAFLSARLIETGCATRYLGQHPHELPQIQQYRSHFPMPAEHFLWQSNSPLKALGGIHDSAGYMAEMNRKVLASPSNLFIFLKAGIKSGLKQFFLLDLGDGLAAGEFAQLYLYPENHTEYLTAKQKSGIDFEKLNQYCLVFFIVLACFFFFRVFPDGISRELKQMALFIILLLTMSALVNGALSTPLNRYQVRVSWLLYFWLLAACLPVLQKFRFHSPNHRS